MIERAQLAQEQGRDWMGIDPFCAFAKPTGFRPGHLSPRFTVETNSESLRPSAGDIEGRRFRGCPLPIAAQAVRQERRLRLLRGNRLPAWDPISQIIAQLLVRSWDNGWDNRRGSTRDRIALKRRQRNDLVGFELFFRSQMLYPTELRARSETLHCQQFTASSSSISTSRFGSFEPLVRNPWMRYLSHAKQFK